MNTEAIVAMIVAAIIIGGGFVRLENRLTKIETNITWLIGILKKCLPNLEENSE